MPSLQAPGKLCQWQGPLFPGRPEAIGSKCPCGVGEKVAAACKRQILASPTHSERQVPPFFHIFLQRISCFPSINWGWTPHSKFSKGGTAPFACYCLFSFFFFFCFVYLFPQGRRKGGRAFWLNCVDCWACVWNGQAKLYLLAFPIELSWQEMFGAISETHCWVRFFIQAK